MVMEDLWMCLLALSLIVNIIQFATAWKNSKDQVQWFNMFVNEFEEKKWWRNKAKERDSEI